MSKVSLVLPVFNEEMNLTPFYSALSGCLEDFPAQEWEILFVDDGSSDRSFSVMTELQRKDPRVQVLRLPYNTGSHRALAAGLEQASGDAAVMMSVDLQDPPAIIGEFLKEWKKGAEVVWGTRRSRKDPWLRKIFTKMFYSLVRQTVLPGYPEGGLDCSLIDRRVIDALRGVEIRGTSLFAVIFSMKFRQAFVPYDRAARAGGVSKFPFHRLLKMAFGILLSFSGGEYKRRAA